MDGAVGEDVKGVAASGSAVSLNDVMDLLRKIDAQVSKDKAPQMTATFSPTLSAHKPPDMQSACSEPANARLAPDSWANPAVIERVLYSREQIATRVKEVAALINKDYADATEDSFVIVGLLTGVFVFMADLCRELTIPHTCDFIVASSYGLGTVSGADVKIKKDLDGAINGKDVLLLDEMCDSGRTMASLQQLLQSRGARSVKTCVFLDKASRRSADVYLDYVGFECEDEFLVGYGMDWSRRFRTLPDICVVAKAAYMT